MNKKSAIALVMLFTLAIPMMASVQRQEMEHQHRKEMRHEHRPRVMHNKDFKMMCEVVDDASFHEKKIGVIKVACISSYFNSKQCAKLLSMIPFDDAKLKALKVLAPRMIGRDVTDIVKQFTFSSNKDKALEILRKAHQLKPSEF
ncbi:MAG: DUF4476 domain-containing protein [Bacteroidaceae bacterium]|jgi:hypothetical protein|nr:DUF4476 domain-containing protein [Bacteroidaceae bacterium]MBQ5654928.1 DUF4476 domain-containing protein [Bacteroidaceae bacterium]